MNNGLHFIINNDGKINKELLFILSDDNTYLTPTITFFKTFEFLCNLKFSLLSFTMKFIISMKLNKIIATFLNLILIIFEFQIINCMQIEKLCNFNQKFFKNKTIRNYRKMFFVGDFLTIIQRIVSF